MARTANEKLDSKTARAKLKYRQKSPNKPYCTSIRPRLSLGYIKAKAGAGRWVAVVNEINAESGYRWQRLVPIGLADDLIPADGEAVFSYDQAMKRAGDPDGLRAQRAAASGLTVAVAIEKYIENLKATKGGAAAKDAKLRLNKHVVPPLASVPVANLTLTQLREWRNALVTGDDAITQSTANRVMANLKAALNLVFKDDNGIPSDKAWRALDKFEDADTAREDHFEMQDVQKLIDEAGKFDRPFANLLTALFVTGCRYGELTACNVSAFDAKRGVLSIPSGKTGKRPVTLMADAIDFFKRVTHGRKAGEVLLPRQDGDRWGKNHQTRPMQRAIEAAELPTSATIYSLRHSHISRAIEEDVPLFIIARNCGTSERMIRKHYAKLIAAKERAMMERAAGAFKLRVITGGKRVA